MPAAHGSFVRWGPFYALQLRLGLLSASDLAVGRRSVLFVAFAWVPAVALALLQGMAWNARPDQSLLLDFSAYAIAVAMVSFVLMERSSERQMAGLIGQFAARGIVLPASLPAMQRIRERMERRTGSWRVEAALLLCAYVLSYLWIRHGAGGVEGGTWFGRIDDGALRPTLAGWWTLLVALPLYLFLLARWLWRFVTWGLMLREIAGCELRLVATHPDRCGGLAFVGHYPKTFVLFAFAISTVVSATALKLIVHGNAELSSFKFAMAGMVLLFAVAFALPLLVFSPRLVLLKRQGLNHYGALVSQHNLAFEAKWVGGMPQAAIVVEPPGDLLGSPDASSLADLSAGYDLIKRMLPIPLTGQSAIPVLLAALAPVLCAAATQIPIGEILARFKDLAL